MSNLKPASVLMDQRIKELTQLDRELRLLEGNAYENEAEEEEIEGGLSGVGYSEHLESSVGNNPGLSANEMEQIK